ncbi:pentapeptide repeat-containing protein [Haloarcula sebkhae]|uniref:Pentapeptide repeat-containing protein n=1 Tax=Haloarcula sebkhae TaxID=932660 RepID=A0ACC6VGQ6_9EURY|nr:pentapeptide repeat-containing protein [Haloarcula sebkhae]
MSASENGYTETYDCQRDAKTGSDWCIWHTPSENKSAEEVVDSLQGLDSGSDINGAEFRNLDFSKTNLPEQRIELDRVGFVDSDFRFSVIGGLEFIKCDLRNTDFQGSDLYNIVFNRTNLSHCDFSAGTRNIRERSETDKSSVQVQRKESNLRDVKFLRGIYNETIFSDAELRECDIKNISLENPELSGTEFQRGKAENLNIIGGTIAVDFNNVEIISPTFEKISDADISFQYNLIESGNFHFEPPEKEDQRCRVNFKQLDEGDITLYIPSQNVEFSASSCENTEFEFKGRSPEAKIESLTIRQVQDQSGLIVDGPDIVSADLESSDFSTFELAESNIETIEAEAIVANQSPELDNVEISGGEITESKLCDGTFETVHISQVRLSSVKISDGVFDGVCFINLQESNDVDFSNSLLTNCTFSDSCISDADMASTTFKDGNTFIDVILNGADFSHASLVEVNLNSVILRGCLLVQTDLRDADLAGAELHDVHTSSTRINSETSLGSYSPYELRADRMVEMDCGEDSLDHVDWKQRGREIENRRFYQRLRPGFRRLRNRGRLSEERNKTDTELLDNAIRVYRMYQNLLRQNALMHDFRGYRIRERHTQRKKAKANQNYSQWLKLVLLRITSRYGESYFPVVVISGVVIFVWSLVYYISGTVRDVSGSSNTTINSFSEAVALSIGSFTSTGSSGLEITTTSIRLLQGAESIIGAVLVAVFVAVLVRRATL